MRNINKKVKEAYRKYELNGPPSWIQLVEILKRLGFSIQPYTEDDISDFGEQIPPAYTLDSDDRVVMYDDTLNERDLVIAFTHELAHIMLNHFHRHNGPQDTSTYKDYEADIFVYKLFTYKRRRVKNIIFTISLVLCFLNLGYSSFLMRQDTKPVSTQITNQTPDVITQSNYVITSSGKKYHQPHCYYVKYKSNIITITKSEAEQLGKKPCDVCVGY